MKKKSEFFYILFFICITLFNLYTWSNNNKESLVNKKLNFVYKSSCLYPQFTPDEKSVVFWDYDYGEYVLKIFHINKKKITKILDRTQQATNPGTVYEEIISQFQRIKFSPNGKLLAIALDGINIEIYDVHTKKIISTLTFRRNKNDLFIGYFYLNWLDDNKIIVGYISRYSNLDYTEDTYGLIKNRNGRFFVTKKVINIKSKLYSKVRFNKKNTIIVFNKRNQIIEIKYIKNENYYPDEILYSTKPNSNKKVVLAVSNTGKYAIVSENLTTKSNVDETYHVKYKTSLVEIPKKFRNKILKLFKTNNE